MTKLEHAIALTQKGFHVFPIKPGAKQPPLIKDFPNRASRSVGQLADWWANWPDANIGISTSRFGDDEALLVIDVDVKGDKDGEKELLWLELEEGKLPDTYTQSTPTGGQHLVYRIQTSVRQSASMLGNGLDVRSKGGYILGAGSGLSAGEYQGDKREIVEATTWLVERCGRRHKGATEPKPKPVGIPVNEKRALSLAGAYMAGADVAVQGQGGDETTYKVAARLKDFGLTESQTSDQMLEFWNHKCVPPWDPEELAKKVRNAYAYGSQPQGISSPEADFAEVFVDTDVVEKVHPYDKINEEYAFVLAGGGAHILWDTKDAQDKDRLEHLTLGSFDAKFAPYKLAVGNKQQQLSKLWMGWKGRREYDGIVFMPEQEAPPRFYNLWKGFAVEPAERMVENESVTAFLEHAKNNVCRGNSEIFRWLIGYFAHVIQRPWDKPLVALVFRGAKGVGKNALIETVGSLLGNHFLLTSNRRYLVGNFNGHLENCLMFVLDEAFWSGDKQAEGTLKDLITGKDHIIEHKGKEPYAVANKIRIVIIGNEEWIVPASYDERRFAVLDVGEGRKQDRTFFRRMREGMESGGHAILLRYLLDFNIAGLDFNDAPQTKALMEQKQHTLEPLHQWWLGCLENGALLCSEFTGWQSAVECERFRSAFRRYVKERQIRSRIPDDRTIGKYLSQCAPSIQKKRLNKRDDGQQPYGYFIPNLKTARSEWDAFIGYSTTWTD